MIKELLNKTRTHGGDGEDAASDTTDATGVLEDTDEDEEDPAEDLLLTESCNILLDAIRLGRRVAASDT